MQADPPDDTVSFGFEETPRAAKAGRVKAVFDSVARRYDLMNDLMSGGMHRLWKDAFADKANPQPGEIVLDLAGGTGDVARRLKARQDRAAERRGLAPGLVIVTDVNEAMLTEGRRRGEDGLAWAVADAERLPIPDASLDLATIAFGIRNVTDIAAVLREARRALKPGGRFLCLEFSRLRVGGLAPVYDAYSFQVLPRVGGVVAGDRASYQYLAESIRRFPDQEAFAGMIRDAGFARVTHHDLAGGIAAIHSGWAV
jgi:demethylmenaquinone methyltransferase/2-methoxy-6-polyprenyl-1,4-benzoquinol methylase